jgi:hypothetical protein
MVAYAWQGFAEENNNGGCNPTFEPHLKAEHPSASTEVELN